VINNLVRNRREIKGLSDDEDDYDLDLEEDMDEDSDCKSISSIRELLIEKSFSQDDDLDEADITESDNENVRSIKSHEDTNNSQNNKDDYYTC
jgi:hypothetical protein